MKKLYTLKSILEQEATPEKPAESPINIKITSTTTAPEDRTAIKWSYQSAWPLTQPNLGTIQEFAKALAVSTEKDATQIKDAITNSDGTAVGISRDPGNTVNKRLFGKDKAEAVGFIHLFNPEIINTKAVPTNKQLTKIADKFTFILDKDIEKYLLEDGEQSDDGVVSNTQNKLDIGTNSKGITAEAFLMQDGDAYEWYNSAPNIIKTYIAPIQSKIGDKRITLENSDPIVGIFWSLLDKLPGGLDTKRPADADADKYTADLKSGIQILLTKAAEYDKNYSPSVVNIDVLTRNLFPTLVEALIIIGLNNSITAVNIENEVLPEKYKAPLAAALAAATGIVDASNNPSNGQSSNNTATANFDGSAINNEIDLAKIMSGGFIGYGKSQTEVDSIDKVKAMWNSHVPADYVKNFDEIVAKLPFNNKTDINLLEFKDIQYFALAKNGTYGPLTKAAFKKAFEKSSIK